MYQGYAKMVTSTSVVVVHPEPLKAEVDGEIILMSVANGLYFGLDDIAGDIWRRLAQPIRVDALCAALTVEYEGEPAVIERDVLALLNKLAERGLIDVSSDGSGS